MTNLAGQRVLVVEDEYFLADDLVQSLTRLGAAVLGPVSSAAAALSLLDSGGPDLAIVDINLKGDISFAIADAMAARNLPFIFATGYDEAAIPGRFSDRPRWQKPYDVMQMMDSLGKLSLSASA
jgi:CheY-like chemotaxis protein